MERARPLLSGVVLSLVAHATATLFLFSLPPLLDLDKRPVAPKRLALDIEAQPSPVGESQRERGSMLHASEAALPGGSTTRQNIDALDPGQGGDLTGALVGMRLLTQDDRILLFDSPLNNVAAAQLQRIRTARDRATLERRRATPNPDDQPFLASGDGSHRERRPVSRAESAEGARVAPSASVEGALTARAADGSEGTTGAGADRGQAPARTSAASADRPGTQTPSPGRGILDGRGQRRTEAARVAFGRPAMDRGPAATEAEAQDARVRDDADAEGLAGSMIQNLLDSTSRTSPREGPGRGGVREGGAPGSGGGRREGGRAAAYGPGDGRFSALDTSDSRYRTWVRESRRRVHDALRFPRERALAMDQGTAIYMIRVNRDGSLRGAPRLVRTSGYGDLDRAALRAIRAATPFSAVPADLAPSVSPIPIRLPVEFSNPMVR